MEEVNYPIKHAGKNVFDISKWFVECGNGFEYVASFNAKYKPTSKISVTGASMTLQDIPEFMKKYKRIGSVNVGARKDLNFELAFNWALKLAMQGGGDVVLLSLSSGMNSLANGISIGPGGSVGFAGGNSSVAASLGLNSSDTKFQGEAGVMLLVFKKNRDFVETRTIGGIKIPEVGEKTGGEIIETIFPLREETQEIRSSLDKEKASPAEMERFVEQLLNG